MINDETARQCIDKMLASDQCSTWLGIRLLEAGVGRAKMSLVITDNMVNGHDLCHGGIIFTLADTTFACTCNGHNQVTVAQGCNIEFLRPALLADTLTADGCEIKRGKTTGICDIKITNQKQQLVALFRGKSYITTQSIL
ncbi:MAG: hydroxyphenylacetyl-CoA thioesterase PaaI [Proteobacteria bacterium]|nr:hydroxyphenylacetyl-CoA thioesterase PaaI [Pseudomonadota bacterium]MCH9758011.1 hydroxyphenylacetyl-CoA thioesterase PaaI [Pseudomonadota bacterium]